jgi:hypothetical protein
MTWTVASGDVACYRWVEIGKTMIVEVFLNTTTVSGTLNSELRIAVPNGRTIGSTGFSYAGCGGVSALDNGAHVASQYIATGGNTHVTVLKSFGANWSASTDNTYLAATFIFPIV